MSLWTIERIKRVFGDRWEFYDMPPGEQYGTFRDVPLVAALKDAVWTDRGMSVPDDVHVLAPYLGTEHPWDRFAHQLAKIERDAGLEPRVLTAEIDLEAFKEFLREKIDDAHVKEKWIIRQIAEELDRFVVP